MTEIKFDVNEVEAIGFELLPEGRYRCIVSESDLVPNKKGTGENLRVTLDVVKGEFTGRKIFENFCWRHENETAVRIARARFAELCKAVGVLAPTDTEQLHNIGFDCIVGVRKGTASGITPGYPDQNTVKRFFPKNTPAGEITSQGESKGEDDLPW